MFCYALYCLADLLLGSAVAGHNIAILRFAYHCPLCLAILSDSKPLAAGEENVSSSRLGTEIENGREMPRLQGPSETIGTLRGLRGVMFCL